MLTVKSYPIVIVAIISSLFSVLGSRLLFPDAQASRDNSQIVTHRLVLVDKNSKMRGQLVTDINGDPHLLLYDRDGHKRLGIKATSDGTGISIHNTKGILKISLASVQGMPSGLCLFSDDQKKQLSVVTHNNGDYIAFTDSKRADLLLSRRYNNKTGIYHYSQGGQISSAWVNSQANGMSSLAFFGSAGEKTAMGGYSPILGGFFAVSKDDKVDAIIIGDKNKSLNLKLFKHN